MNDRQIRAYSILAKGERPLALDSENYIVKAQSNSGKYRVTRSGSLWSCECPDHLNRRVICKHIHTVLFWIRIKAKRANCFSIPEIANSVICPFCKSTETIKRGIRRNEGEPKQRYSCKRCRKRFVCDVCPKYKATDKTICLVMDLYFKGLSLRKIRHHLIQFQNLKVSHVTIHYWIRRCMKSIIGYVDRFQPALSGTWHIDEQFVPTRTEDTGKRGRYAYVWNVLDSSSRFLLSSTVTQGRNREDAKRALREAKNKAENSPERIITDKLISYDTAIRENFPKAEHIRYKGFTATVQNNKIERFHGTFRERDKVMRGLKSVKTADEFVQAFRVYYNFIRPHQGLGGLTPSEVTMNVKPDWLSMIRRDVYGKG